MKRPVTLFHAALLIAGLAASPAFAAPFVSGSTGADGAFAPTANTTVQLPPNGVLNYTTVDIPAGVTVKFARNAANTAAVILTTGAVKIAGVIDVSGGNSLMTKVGLVGDVNQGGIGGPGGFDGARGGLPEQNRIGGTGLGPGGAGGGIDADGTDTFHCSGRSQGGGGGGFAAAGEGSICVQNSGYLPNIRTGFAGPAYGANAMLPLVGGSGGGGGAGGAGPSSLPGTGGGGGGGALMIVAAGPVELAGSILAKGGNAANINNNDCSSLLDTGGAGGGGSGGAVRIITPGFSGAGVIDVSRGLGGCRIGGGATSTNQVNAGGHGSAGRSSVETVTSGSFSLTALPSLAINSIGGVAVPANPTGAGDVALPADAPNPAEVTITASGVPLGTIVKLTLSQPYNVNVTANASALAGTVAASTSTGSISIPSGTSVLMASTTYALTLAQGQALSIYAQGEQVQKVELAATLGGPSKITLITISGKTFEVPAAVLAMLPG